MRRDKRFRNGGMKKASIVIILATILCLCLVLVACQSPEEGTVEGTGGTTTLQAVEVEIAEGSLYSQYYEGGVIRLPEGVAANFTKSDFIVTGIYGSQKKTVPDYELSVSKPTPRTLLLEFVIAENVMGQITVELSVEVLPSVNTEGLTFSYTGEEIDIAAHMTLSDGTGVLSAIAEEKIIVDTAAMSVRKATDANVYVVVLLCKDGYVWQNEGVESDRADIVWEITKKELPVPTVEGEGVYEYTGSELTLDLDMHEAEKYINFENFGSETNKATDAGRYFCVATIKEEYQNNFIFSGADSSSSTVDVATWLISPKKLPVPTVSGAEKADGYYHFTYTGSPVIPTLTVGETALVAVSDLSGAVYYSDASCAAYGEGLVTIVLGAADAAAIDAGSGTYNDGLVNFHAVELLINSDYQNNYVWEGAPDGASMMTIGFVIDKARTSLPADFGQNFKLKYLYSGEEDVEVASCNLQISPNDRLKLIENGTFDGTNGLWGSRFMMTDEVKDYLAANGIAIYENVNLPLDDSYQVINPPAGNNYEFVWAENASFGEDNIAKVGTTYHWDLIYKKGATELGLLGGNYQFITVTVEVEVVKGVVCYSYLSGGPIITREDGGMELTYSRYGSGVEMEFAVAPGLEWTGDALIDAEHRFSRTQSGEYGVVTTLTQAGYYRSYFTLRYDKELFVAAFLDGNGRYTVTDTVEYDWEIQKRTFYVNEPTEYTLNFDSNRASYYPGAHYSDYSGNGTPVTIEVPVEYAVTVWHRSGEEEAFVEVVPSLDGEYDLSAAGQYKVVVTICNYDDNNYLLMQPNPIVVTR